MCGDATKGTVEGKTSIFLMEKSTGVQQHMEYVSKKIQQQKKRDKRPDRKWLYMQSIVGVTIRVSKQKLTRDKDLSWRSDQGICDVRAVQKHRSGEIIKKEVKLSTQNIEERIQLQERKYTRKSGKIFCVLSIELERRNHSETGEQQYSPQR